MAKGKRAAASPAAACARVGRTRLFWAYIAPPIAQYWPQPPEVIC